MSRLDGYNDDITALAARSGSRGSAEMRLAMLRRRRRDHRQMVVGGVVLGAILGGLIYVAATTPAPVDDAPSSRMVRTVDEVLEGAP